MKKKASGKSAKKEDKFDMLARLLKEEGEDIRISLRKEIKEAEGRLDRRMDVGFTEINRRLDDVIQTQLSDHAHRLKILETKVFS